MTTPWILILVALGAGVMLREAARGLACRLPRPRWSAGFVGTWAGSSVLLLTVLLASASSLGSGTWISIALAVCLGLVLAASLPRARQLLSALTRLRRRIPARTRASTVPIPCALTVAAPVPAPLLAGWSDRGPPPRLS
jgi:ABC-type nitrate/sulfonate/bicarbonate transport system permease component